MYDFFLHMYMFHYVCMVRIKKIKEYKADPKDLPYRISAAACMARVGVNAT